MSIVAVVVALLFPLLSSLLQAQGPSRPHSEIALQYLKHGDLARAEQEVRAGIHAGESQAEACNLLGIILDKRGRPQEAEGQYRRALALEPEAAQIHHNLGNNLLRQNRVPEAVEEFEATLRVQPSHLNAHYTLGRIRNQQGRFEEAARHLEIASEGNPQDALSLFDLCNAYFQLKKTKQAVEVADQISRVAGDNWDVLFALGVLLAENREYPQAARELLKVAARQPSRPDVFYYLGVCNLALSRPDGAKEYFRRALQTLPGHPASSYYLGGILADEGAFAEAVALFENVADRDGEYQAKARMALGRLYCQTNNYGKAIAQLDLLDVGSRGFDEWFCLGISSLELDRLEEATNDFNQALVLRPESADVHYNLGMVEFQKHNNIKAAGHVVTALKLQPKYVDALSLLGSICLLEKAAKDAVEAFRTCVRLRPESSSFRFLLGAAYLAGDQRTEAVTELQNGLRLSPDSSLGHYYMGLALKKMSNDDQAIEVLRRALELQPGYMDAEYELAESLITRGSNKEAVKVIEGIIRRKRDHCESYCAWARIEMAEERYSSALQKLEQAVRCDPVFLKAHFLLGRVYKILGKTSEAREEFTIFRTLSERQESAEREKGERRLTVLEKR